MEKLGTSRRDRIDPGEPVELPLSENERALLLSLPTIDLVVEDLLGVARHEKGLVYLVLTLDEFDELAGCVAFEANHTEDQDLQKRLDELYARIADLLDEHTEEQGPESDVRRLLEEAVNRVLGEMGGLSPLQLAHLIYSDWDDPKGAVHLNDELTVAELQHAPILVNARILLQAVQEADGVKATAAGNLNRKFVGEMLETLDLPSDYVEQVKALNKVINEQDVSPLHVVRIIVELARLLRRTKGVFKVTRKSKELLADDEAGVLYALLFRTYFRKFNLGYSDRLPELPEIQNAIAFSLFMASKHMDDWRTKAELAELLFLPVVKEAIAEFRFSDYPGFAVSSRVLNPLGKFGLVEQRERKTGERLSERVQARKTELFDRFLSFSFAPHLRLV